MECGVPFTVNEKKSLVELCTNYETQINPNKPAPSADLIRARAWETIHK